MTKIITVALPAGGTGKSLIAKTLGEWLARQGYKTAIFDADHQHSISESYDNYDSEGTFLNVFTGGDVNYVPISENLWLVPSHIGLADIPGKLLVEGTQNVQFIFEGWLEQHEKEILEFDYIVIDTHPDVLQVTLNALAVSHLQLGVVEPNDKSIGGVIKAEVALEELIRDTTQVIKMDGTKQYFPRVTCELALIGNNLEKVGNSYTKPSQRLLKLMENDPRYLGIIPNSVRLQNSDSGDKISIWEQLEDESKLSWANLKFKKEIEKTMQNIKQHVDSIA